MKPVPSTRTKLYRAVVLLGVTASCAGPARSADGGPTGSATGSALASSTSSAYDVHEWGLVRADQGDTVRIGAVAPPLPAEIFIMDKPVLYFLPEAAMRLDHVTIDAMGGAVLETWPLAEPGPSDGTMTWSNVSIDPKSACPFSPLPHKDEAPCSNLPKEQQCESVGLAAVRTVDASCVRVGGKTDTFLFYRTETRGLTPPLRFTIQSDGSVVVTNDGDAAIPGLLLRIDMAEDLTRTLSVTPPAPHAKLVVGRDFPDGDVAAPIADDRGVPRPRVVTGPARKDLRSTMLGLGLSDTEVDAFLKSWDETLFGSPSNGGFRPVTTGTSFLYFLPEATVERAAKVTFDPPPRAFRRAFALWTHMPTSGESR
ncbi:MAG: hypothetical protein U0271_38170 [Polyangiaceae bacterium]